ncbi:hypothetical protein BDL97_08G014000 [Sphagnum fallax]|nr:hypothetical protein BDL97_08G014000 [Sphagnum fallax]
MLVKSSMVQTALVAQLQSISCSWPWVSPSSKPLPQQQQKKKTKQQENLPSRPPRQRVDLRKLLDRTTGDSTDSTVAVPGSGRMWLPQPPFVEKPRAVHNAASLAYLGDVIYEVYVRCHFLTPPQSIDKYTGRVTALVCCEAQDAMLRHLLKDDFLSEDERNVVRWGKNIETGQRRATRRAGAAVYSSASSLETLIGYLYLTNQQRLEELMAKLGFSNDNSSLLAGFGLPQIDTSIRPSL